MVLRGEYLQMPRVLAIKNADLMLLDLVVSSRVCLDRSRWFRLPVSAGRMRPIGMRKSVTTQAVLKTVVFYTPSGPGVHFCWTFRASEVELVIAVMVGSHLAERPIRCPLGGADGPVRPVLVLPTEMRGRLVRGLHADEGGGAPDKRPDPYYDPDRAVVVGGVLEREEEPEEAEDGPEGYEQKDDPAVGREIALGAWLRLVLAFGLDTHDQAGYPGDHEPDDLEPEVAARGAEGDGNPDNRGRDDADSHRPEGRVVGDDAGVVCSHGNPPKS